MAGYLDERLNRVDSLRDILQLLERTLVASELFFVSRHSSLLLLNYLTLSRHSSLLFLECLAISRQNSLLLLECLAIGRLLLGLALKHLVSGAEL